MKLNQPLYGRLIEVITMGELSLKKRPEGGRGRLKEVAFE